MKQAPLIDVQPGGEPDEIAGDAAYQQLAEKAQAQKKGWTVDRVEGDDACASRLNEIAQLDGIMHEVWFLPERTFVIIWWTLK